MTAQETANNFLAQSQQIITKEAAAKLQGDIAEFVKAHQDSERGACRTALVAYVQAGLFVAENSMRGNTLKDHLLKVQELDPDRRSIFVRLMSVCSFETNFAASFDETEVVKIIDQAMIDKVKDYVKSELPTRLAATMAQPELEVCLAAASATPVNLTDTLKEPVKTFLGSAATDQEAKDFLAFADPNSTSFCDSFTNAAQTRLTALKTVSPVVEIAFKFEHLFKNFQQDLQKSKMFQDITFDPNDNNKATISDAAKPNAKQSVTTIQSDSKRSTVTVVGSQESAPKVFVKLLIADLLAQGKISRNPLDGKLIAKDNYRFGINRNTIELNKKDGTEMTTDEKEVLFKTLDKELQTQLADIYISSSILNTSGAPFAANSSRLLPPASGAGTSASAVNPLYKAGL